jgi:UDP:flavonoid glycosyltransferase YjiC (YdhE family)
VLDQHPAPEEIRAAVERLLQDDDVARAAAVIGARLRGQDGSGEAADRIEVAAGVGTAYAGPR